MDTEDGATATPVLCEPEELQLPSGLFISDQLLRVKPDKYTKVISEIENTTKDDILLSICTV